MDYGKALRIARAARGLSQKQLGTLIGKDASYISRLESGERTPSMETLEDLAKQLSLPLYLLVLLGSNDEDLNGIPPKLASEIGQNLLNTVIHAQRT